MPHIILEYTENVKEKSKFQELFVQLHQIIVEVANASLESCKSRAIKHKNFFIGNGDVKNAFIYVQILLMEGRPLSVRKELGEKILAALEKHFSKSLEELNLQISVEPKELSEGLYFKIPLGSI
jgi:5-carboxymethyl-2-hydroxymuconate isomerase